MPYLIDGHNLIPKLGLRLDALDDEEALIKKLQAFCIESRKHVEVFFDKAPAGRSRTKNFGMVTAHFVSERITADAAIKARLKGLKSEAQNWTVVTSDNAVQSAARSAHAQVLSSDEFANQVLEAAQKTGNAFKAKNADRPEVDGDELKAWLKEFGAEDEE